MGRKSKSQEFYYIGKTWRIDLDSLNFILQHKGTNKEGGEGTTWKTVGFFQTVKQLYNALVEKGIKESNLADIKILNEKMDELHSLINKGISDGFMEKEKVNG